MKKEKKSSRGRVCFLVRKKKEAAIFGKKGLRRGRGCIQ